MREILFRGKRLNGDGWVYGDLSYHVHNGEVYVFPGDGYDSPDCYEVDPDTVGQYTGLQDKNGSKIFEGDIVLAPLWKGRRLELTKGIIEFSKGVFSVVWKDSMYEKHFAGYVADMEVIGNIFDNPKLGEK